MIIDRNTERPQVRLTKASPALNLTVSPAVISHAQKPGPPVVMNSDKSSAIQTHKPMSAAAKMQPIMVTFFQSDATLEL